MNEDGGCIDMTRTSRRYIEGRKWILMVSILGSHIPTRKSLAQLAHWCWLSLTNWNIIRTRVKLIMNERTKEKKRPTSVYIRDVRKTTNSNVSSAALTCWKHSILAIKLSSIVFDCGNSLTHSIDYYVGSSCFCFFLFFFDLNFWNNVPIQNQNSNAFELTRINELYDKANS